MKKCFLMAAVIISMTNVNAQQKEYPKQEPMKPGMSEYWTPQPKVVTPGDIKTNTAPSDAIVLFDGKDRVFQQRFPVWLFGDFQLRRREAEAGGKYV